MSEKTTPPGASSPGSLAGLRSTPAWQELTKALAIQERKQSAWRELRNMALERMRDALKEPGAIECPALLNACERVATAEPGDINAAFSDFQEAIVARSRTSESPREQEAIKQLANRVCDLYQAIAEAAAKQLEASKAADLIREQAARLAGENPNPGGIH